MAVRELPPKAFLSRRVSLESRYGTWLWPVAGTHHAEATGAGAEAVTSTLKRHGPDPGHSTSTLKKEEQHVSYGKRKRG